MAEIELALASDLYAVRTLATEESLDTVLPGRYRLYASHPENPSSEWGILHAWTATTYRMQEFVSRAGIYVRVDTGSGWTGWTKQ